MVSKGKIKFVQSLKHKKYRLQNNAFVAEGGKLIGELLHSNIKVSQVFATGRWQSENHELLDADAIITTATPKDLERLSFQQHPQEVLAICELPNWEATVPAGDTWHFFLDDLRDPGNLGTIIRSADWFGLEAIYCSPTTVDCYNPKVVQATMGSIARVKVVYRPFEELAGRLPVYGAAMEGLPVSELPARAKGLIAIGNEANGLPEVVLQRATPVTIPRRGKAESLNAAMAAGIIMSVVAG